MQTQHPIPAETVKIDDGYMVTVYNHNGQNVMTECETITQGLAELASELGVNVSDLYVTQAE